MLTPEQKAARKLLRDLREDERIARALVRVMSNGRFVVFQSARGHWTIAFFDKRHHAYAHANAINDALGFERVE